MMVCICVVRCFRSLQRQPHALLLGGRKTVPLQGSEAYLEPGSPLFSVQPGFRKNEEAKPEPSLDPWESREREQG